MTATLGLAGASNGVLVVAFVIIVILALFAYGAARRHRARFGVNPWGLPAWAWSVLVFLFPITLVLFAIAVLTTRPRSPRRQSPRSSSAGPAADVQHSADRYGLGSSHPPPLRLPPAGWYADPSRRHEQRYWDGKGWSEHVSDQGTRSIDPG